MSVPQAFRLLVVNAILATDMSNHKKCDSLVPALWPLAHHALLHLPVLRLRLKRECEAEYPSTPDARPAPLSFFSAQARE